MNGPKRCQKDHTTPRWPETICRRRLLYNLGPALLSTKGSAIVSYTKASSSQYCAKGILASGQHIPKVFAQQASMPVSSS